MLKIRDFARLAEVSMTTLRYYDEIGLFKPVHVDEENGYRFYSIDQLPQFHRILAFKELGLELTQIAEILDQGVSPKELQGMLRFRQAQIQQRVLAEQQQLERIEARLRSLEQGHEALNYEVVLKAIKPIVGVALPLTTNDLAEHGYWHDALDDVLRRYDIKPIDHLVVLHPENEAEDMLRSVEIVAPVDWRSVDRLIMRSEGRLIQRELPAVPHMACTIHHGHPTMLLSAYQAIGAWMETNGYTIVGPRRKIRLRRDDDLDDALTEIQFPVEKVA